MDVKTWRQNKRAISRTRCLQIEGYRKVAAEQLAIVQSMIGDAGQGDLQAQALIALATENAAKTVEKMYRVIRREGYHELA